MEAIKVILVTTAGKVGSAAARLIAQQDFPVRVVVRHPEKSAPLAQAGVEIPGDLDSPESKASLLDVGFREPLAKDNALAVASMADRDGDYVTDDVGEILGRRTGSFQQFTIDHAQAFS